MKSRARSVQSLEPTCEQTRDYKARTTSPPGCWAFGAGPARTIVCASVATPDGEWRVSGVAPVRFASHRRRKLGHRVAVGVPDPVLFGGRAGRRPGDLAFGGWGKRSVL